MPEDPIDHIDFEKLNNKAIIKTFGSHIYTADPSAHFLMVKFIFTPLMILMLEMHLMI